MPPDVSTRQKLPNWNVPHEKAGRYQGFPRRPMWDARGPSSGSFTMQGGRRDSAAEVLSAAGVEIRDNREMVRSDAIVVEVPGEHAVAFDLDLRVDQHEVDAHPVLRQGQGVEVVPRPVRSDGR